jgi:prepilin-type N-terminal cleavage/methylation domain-containing protein
MSNLRALRARANDGFTLLEIVVVLAIGIIIAGVALPYMNRTLSYMRLSGAARSVSNAVGASKMRSAAKFTRARLYVDRAGNSFHLETLDTSVLPLPPAGGHWVADGGTTYLPTSVTFGFGPITAPPSNTQTVIGQAAPCTDDNLAVIANTTSCIMFNSRGVPIKTNLNPEDQDALYITDGTNVYGVTVLATGFIGTWHTPSAAVPAWVIS